MQKLPAKQSDPLTEHYNIVRKMSQEDRACFNDFFIGALSNYVPDKKWMDCLRTATQCLNALTTTTTPAPAPSDPDADKGGADSPILTSPSYGEE